MLVGDPIDGNTLYFGGISLWTSRDGAKSWFKHSDPISDQPDQGFISTIAVSPSNPDVVYFGAGNGVFRRTAQAKSTPLGSLPVWIDISTGLPKRFVTSVNISPIDPLQAAVSFGGVGTAKVFLTYDGGANWINISGNLPDIPTNAVVIDPDLADTLYVGTDVGVFFTLDRGTTWNPLGHGLPRVAVWDMKMHRPSRILRLLTYGRGMWDAAVPIQYSGPALAISPQTFRFPDSNVNTSSTASITLSNIGSSTLSLGTISATPGFVSASHCGSTLAATTSCSIDVSFTPLEPGAASGVINLPNDAVNAINKVFVNGYGLLPADNDLYASARVIDVPDYHAKMTTFNATRSIDEPAANCPFSIPNKSVWFRYTALSPVRVSLNTAGSDYNPTITVWTGNPGTFRNVTCAFSFSQAQTTAATFDTTAGTEYSILVSHERDTGGLLALNFAAGAIPSIVPPSISSVFPDHRTAGSNGFTLNLKGSSFTSTSVVRLAGTTLPTTFVSASELNAQVSAALLTSVGDVGISVVDGQSTSSAVTFSVTGLTLNATTTMGTVSAGQPGKFTIALSPSGGAFDAAVTFSCANLPQLSSCSFAPATITPGSQQTTTTLTISTTGPGVTSAATQRQTFLAVFLLAPLFAGAMKVSRRRGFAALLAIALLLCGVACGGGGGGGVSPGPTNNPVPRTPAGTYTITVQVTSGAYSVNTPVTLAVQ
ncbi:MAG TPA: choice-of-anchor D domain-containing protein, partial [Terriglobales bacterium]|nr:choice-of-anchor D domain-containing protein [Terriglobales bacterium]